MKSFDKLREALSENGEIIYTTVIPEDHIILSVEAFIEYIERIGFKVIRD
ncbi:NYN domain-containing protein [Escherichia coli]|nr:NYN domain-containing protein [Escherichia coli]